MSFIIALSLPIIVFIIGIFGIYLNRKNILLTIICIELVLLSLNFSFLLGSYYLDDIFGQIFCIMIVTVASAETSIGLAILISYYRLRGSITVDALNYLKN